MLFESRSAFGRDRLFFVRKRAGLRFCLPTRPRNFSQKHGADSIYCLTRLTYFAHHRLLVPQTGAVALSF